jgi:hypothetical protein
MTGENFSVRKELMDPLDSLAKPFHIRCDVPSVHIDDRRGLTASSD